MVIRLTIFVCSHCARVFNEEFVCGKHEERVHGEVHDVPTKMARSGTGDGRARKSVKKRQNLKLVERREPTEVRSEFEGNNFDAAEPDPGGEGESNGIAVEYSLDGGVDDNAEEEEEDDQSSGMKIVLPSAVDTSTKSKGPGNISTEERIRQYDEAVRNPPPRSHRKRTRESLKCRVCASPAVYFATTVKRKRHEGQTHGDELTARCDICDDRFFTDEEVIEHKRDEYHNPLDFMKYL